MVCIRIEHKSSCNSLFSIYIYIYIAKILPASQFGHFGHVWPLPSKMIMPSCRNFDVYLASVCKKFFLRYCEDNTKLLFWVLWECLIMLINNDRIILEETLMLIKLKSTCRKLRCVFTYKKPTSSVTSFFEIL